MAAKRDRAGGIVICEGRILLMHRVKEGREYYCMPGGGVKRRETPEEACTREMREETSLDIDDLTPFCHFEREGVTEYYFLVGRFSGTVELGGPEKERCSEENHYRLDWIELDRLSEVLLLPDELKRAILAHGDMLS